MQYTDSYQSLVDTEGERADELDRMRDAFVDVVEEKLKSGKDYFGFNLDDTEEYKELDGLEEWEAIEAIADEIIKRNPIDVIRDEL